MEKPIVFRNKGQQLVGMVHIPESEGGRVPAVLMLHGFTGHRIETHRLFVRAARRFAERGIGAFRFDFRGSGESEGRFEDMTVHGELSDAVAAWEFMKAEIDEIDTERLGVLGFSLGGCVAAMLAGRLADQLKALVLWSAVSEEPSDNFDYFKSMFENRPNKSVDWVEHSGYLVGRRFFEELDNVRPLADVRNYHGPVLIAHGSEDRTVSPEHAKTYFEALRNNSDARLHIIEGAGHTYLQRKHEEQLIRVTVEFLEKHLK